MGPKPMRRRPHTVPVRGSRRPGVGPASPNTARGRGGGTMVKRPLRTLIAIPVYNEQRYVQRVLELVLEYARATGPTPAGADRTNWKNPASDQCHAQQVLVIDD